MSYFKKSKNIFNLLPIFLLILFLNLITFSQTKKGGICFRIGGNGPLAKLQDLDNLFVDHYNNKFCLGLDFGLSPLDDINYVNEVKTLQSHGHEIMDHSPNHRTNYFNTTYDYSGVGSGISKIIDYSTYNKVCLEYGAVNTADAVGSGTVSVNGNTLTSTSGDFPDFLSNEYYYLYIPDLSQLLLVNSVNSPTEITVTDPWVEAIDLGTSSGHTYYYFNNYSIHMTTEALGILADESLRLASAYGISRPTTWIQPGGANSFLSKEEAMAAFSSKGYTASSGYPEASIKVFNEYNSGGVKRYGMNWGDFQDDALTLSENEKLIADGVALHKVLIGHAYFPDDDAIWTNYLTKVGYLLDWCHDKNIPVRTYSEWADILYDPIGHPTEPTENIIPQLNVDLDEDGIPDGYIKGADADFNTDDGAGISGTYNYSIATTGQICSISNLGGLYKGDNDFEIYLKGNVGDQVLVTFHGNSTALDHEFYFTINSASWSSYYLPNAWNTDGLTKLTIPEEESTMNITVAAWISTGTIKVSSMRFAEYGTLPVELMNLYAINKGNEIELKWKTATEVNNYGFEVERTIQNSELRTQNSEWEKIGFVKGNGNSNSPKDYSYADNIINGGSFKYRLKQIDNDGNYTYSNEIEIKTVPAEFALLQNYPNPFNPVTSIEYSLPIESKVTLEVFNILGAKVADLVNEVKPAGSYTVKFDGGRLSSGTYFCRMQAGNFTQIKKLSLLK